jgi:hypothetical protein
MACLPTGVAAEEGSATTCKIPDIRDHGTQHMVVAIPPTTRYSGYYSIVVTILSTIVALQLPCSEAVRDGLHK